MKKNDFLRTRRMSLMAMLLAVVLPMGFSACSSDDDDNNTSNNTEQEEDDTKTNDLAYFQKAIVQTDTLGNFMYYHWGEELYANDKGHLYIGVDDYAAAEKILNYWIPADMTLTKTSTRSDDVALTYVTGTFTDEDGNAQTTLYFAPGEDTHVAEVTFSDDSQLPYFYQITFMYNSAWPYNSGDNKWEVGNVLKNITLTSTNNVQNQLADTDKTLNFVCIREAGNGYKPMFVAVTNEVYKCGYKSDYPDYDAIRFSGFAPDKSGAGTIQSLMNENWDVIENALNNAGSGPFSGTTDYWIDEKTNMKWYAYQYKDGTTTGYKSSNKQRFLLYFDNKADSDIEDGMTVKVTSH